MAVDRREHVRYEPKSRTEVLLLWQDETGAHRVSGWLADLSAGGCALAVTDAPQPGAPAVARIALPGSEGAAALGCRVVSRSPQGPAVLVSLRFERLAEGQLDRLQAVLASDAFQPLQSETNQSRRKFWRVPQWAAFLTIQQLPVMPRSKLALASPEARKGEELSAHELARLAHGDPFLCLVLLREAEARRSARLGHETSTPLAAVMQIGEAAFRELLLSSPETDEGEPGLGACEARAVLAGRLAAEWSTLRADASPDEVSMAALLSEIGELMLWHYAPELPRAVLELRAAGKGRRTVEAQQMACGFKFHELTLKCAELWKLPAILTQLIRGHDTVRAKLARVCQDTARHLMAAADNPALPDDLADAQRLIPGVTFEQLVGAMPQLPEEARDELIGKAIAATETPSAARANGADSA